MGEVVPIRARERVELPPAPPQKTRGSRPLPWRFLAALLVPAGSLAAASGLQRALEGPAARGDALSRWLFFASAIGVLFGALAGLALGRGLAGRLRWTAFGALSPWVLALGSTAAAKAVRPLRDRITEQRIVACRAEGRPACSLDEFRRGCSAAGSAASGARPLARKLLGPPAQELCEAQGCTDRFRYEGPWTPDNWVAPGAVVCSVVSDGQGRGIRSALSPGTAPR